MRRITSLIAGAALAASGLIVSTPAGHAAENSRLLFVRQVPNEDTGLWVRDAAGERPLIDGPLNERRPRWSPDGADVAYSRFADTETTSDVVVLTRDGRELNLGVDGVYDDRPVWSPDGSHIAFLSSRDSDNNSQFGADVFVARLDATRSTVLRVGKVIDMKYGIWGVDWSPDGKSLAISGWGNGGRDLFEAPLTDPFTAGALRNITQTSSVSEDDPEWSPDGGMISFTEDRSNGKSVQVAVISRDGSGRRILTSGKARSNAATWALDGASLTFGSDRSGKSWDLYSLDLVSTAVSVLVGTDGVGENSADWGRVPVTNGGGDGDGDDDPALLPAPLPPLG